jgi:glucose-1-phosphate thymidylyltransferase
MIDMPIEFLKRHGVDQMTIVTGHEHTGQICEYVEFAHDDIEFNYVVQPKPAGIADVIKRVRHQVESDGLLLILGDNVFDGFMSNYIKPDYKGNSAIAFEYDIKSKQQAKSFGQLVLTKSNEIVGIVEKPSDPQHSRILTGLYYFPADVVKRVEDVQPSKRGELEITDLLSMYLKDGRLNVEQVDGVWSDLGENNPWMDFVSKRSNG